MRILNWNIRRGGGKKIGSILERLAQHDADIVVLTEYQTTNREVLVETLQTQGYRWIETSRPADGENGILVASRHRMVPDPADAHEGDPQRWLPLKFPDLGFIMIAVHIPEWKRGKGRVRKEGFWRKLVTTAAWTDEPLILVGDFNTGLKADTQGARFKLSQYMVNLLDLGYVDAWRSTHKEESEFTWFSQRKTEGETRDFNGFRLDYIFLPRLLAFRSFSSFHSHDERVLGISDHAVLVCDIDVDGFAGEYEQHRAIDMGERQFKWATHILDDPKATTAEKETASTIVKAQKPDMEED